MSWFCLSEKTAKRIMLNITSMKLLKVFCNKLTNSVKLRMDKIAAHNADDGAVPPKDMELSRTELRKM